MSRLFAAFAVVIVALAGTLAAQSRPSFSGRWDLVAEKSTPAGSTGIFGKSVGIQQTETTLTVESTVSVMRGSSVNGQFVSEASESTVTSAYIFDAAEHELKPSGPFLTELAAAAATASAVSLPPPSTYRAIWTTGQLVILVTTKAGPSSTTDAQGTLQRVSRVSLSIDSDGSLVVDSIAIAAPRAGAAKQNPPAPSRSVYVKRN
jgi:hypothetical protein